MKVLFIGNSHTYFNDMPATFAEICRKNGIDCSVTMLTQGGWELSQHYKGNEALFNIKYGAYDFVVLQERAHPLIERETICENFASFAKPISDAGALLCAYITWSERANPCGQKAMAENYCEAAKRAESESGKAPLIAPVGLVWEKVRAERPEAELYWTDGEHASPLGSLIAAYTIYSALTGKQAEAEDENAYYAKTAFSEYLKIKKN